jgi:hypothetical protein
MTATYVPLLQGALRDTPSRLLPFQKPAGCGRTSVFVLSPRNRHIRGTVLHTLYWANQSIGRHSHCPSGPFVVGAGASHNDIAVASLATAHSSHQAQYPVSQCVLCRPPTRQATSSPLHLASNPQFKVQVGSSVRSNIFRPRAASISSCVHLDMRLQAFASSSFVRPSLRAVVERGSLRCLDLLAAASPSRTWRQPWGLATVPRVPRTGRPWSTRRRRRMYICRPEKCLSLEMHTARKQAEETEHGWKFHAIYKPHAPLRIHSSLNRSGTFMCTRWLHCCSRSGPLDGPEASCGPLKEDLVRCKRAADEQSRCPQKPSHCKAL